MSLIKEEIKTEDELFDSSQDPELQACGQAKFEYVEVKEEADSLNWKACHSGSREPTSEGAHALIYDENSISKRNSLDDYTQSEIHDAFSEKRPNATPWIAMSFASEPSTSSASAAIDTEYNRACKKVIRKALSSDESLRIILCPDGAESEDDLDESEDEALAEPTCAEYQEDFETILQHLPNIEVEDSADDDDDVPLSRSEECKWREVDFHPPVDIKWKGSMILDHTWHGKSPTFFFHLFFDNDLIGNIKEQTKMYALQMHGKELQLNNNELKAFLGALMLTGIIKVSNYRSYWSKTLRIPAIANSISRDKFDEIKRYIHFNDNTTQMPIGHANYDKLHKIRPVIEAIRRNCMKMPQEEHQCIDEQIIPTKAHISFKQYNPMKPHKWGYKVISRAGSSGFIYDFEVYTGKDTKNENLGMGAFSGFVARLSEGIPKHKNFKLFFDNWFASVDLTKKLKEDGILCLATISPNRLKNCVLKEEKDLKREGRGTFDHRVELSTNLIAIKWFDNKSVHCLSSYAGCHPVDKARRWDAKMKQYIEIARPFAIKEYNKHIGGVDLCDMLLELYRIDHKSRKWYIMIFFYLIDLSVVNAWLLHRRSCKFLNQNCMTLRNFKEDIALGLLGLHDKTPNTGTPGSSDVEVPKKRQRVSCQPAQSVRHDNLNHFPSYIKVRRRCKECIKGVSRVICLKCNVGLCLTQERNCFLKFHKM